MKILKNPITGKPANPVQSEILEMQREYANSNYHDASSELSEIALALKAIYGVLVQQLQRMEENTSLSFNEFLYVNQTSATQNTVYSTNVSTLNGKCRGIFLNGTGNVTLYHYSSTYSPSGRITLGIFPLNNSSIFIPFSVNVQPQSYFAVSTDTASNGTCALSVWIEPVSLTGKDLYAINNTPGM